jgi:hypothetical protein
MDSFDHGQHGKHGFNLIIGRTSYTTRFRPTNRRKPVRVQAKTAG